METQVYGNIVFTSFYTNIAVCLLIFLAGAAVCARIFWFCRRKKKWSPALVSFGIFWLFSGFTWLFSALSIYLNRFSSTMNFNSIFEILGFHAVIFFGMAVTFHIFYKNFGSVAAWVALVLVAFLGIIYSYFQLSLAWENYINSDWGLSVIPPRPVLVMSLIMGGIFGFIALFDFIVRIYRYIRSCQEAGAIEFFVDLSIVVYFISAVFDVTGNPGWRMVLDRIFILISALSAYIIISETGYLAVNLEVGLVKK